MIMMAVYSLPCTLSMVLINVILLVIKNIGDRGGTALYESNMGKELLSWIGRMG